MEHIDNTVHIPQEIIFYNSKTVKIVNIQYKGVKEILSSIGGFKSSISVPIFLVFKFLLLKEWLSSLVDKLPNNESLSLSREQKLE